MRVCPACAFVGVRQAGEEPFAEEPSETEPEDEDPVAIRGGASCVGTAPNARVPGASVHSGSEVPAVPEQPAVVYH